jgi:hypothetical protein
VEPPPVRWALIFTDQFKGVPVIRRITEDRIQAWVSHGWTLLVKDTDVIYHGLEDIRKEDERGRR